jgi:hypothetical protein
VVFAVIKINVFRLYFNFIFRVNGHIRSCIYFLLLSQKPTQEAPEQEVLKRIRMQLPPVYPDEFLQS